MKPRTLIYCVSAGIRNLFKNRLMSFASITTIAVSILIITVFYTVVANVDFMLTEFEKNIGIAVFFNQEATENDMLALKMAVDQRSEVYRSTYISAEEAWQTFKQDYFEGRADLIEGFGDDNPLKNSASLQILIADITQQGELVKAIKENPHVRYIRETRDVTEMVQALNGFVTYVSAGLLLALVLLALFLISNTIRLAVALRREEINIMRYIGAKNSFIRGPFVVEGMLIGVLGALLPLIAFYYIYPGIILQLQERFLILNDFLVFLSRERMLKRLIPIALLSGASIGFLGSRIAIGRYLKV